MHLAQEHLGARIERARRTLCLAELDHDAVTHAPTPGELGRPACPLRAEELS